MVACAWGHLHVVQWLVQALGVDIHGKQDMAFEVACQGGHLDTALDTAQWLLA